MRRGRGHIWITVIAMLPLGAAAGWWIMQQGMGGLLCFLALMILAPLLIGTVVPYRPLFVALAFNTAVCIAIAFLNLKLDLASGLSVWTALKHGASVFGFTVLTAVLLSFASFLPVWIRADIRRELGRKGGSHCV